MESLEVIVGKALPRLFNTACYLSGTRKDAEDAVQETILAYLERCRKDPTSVRDPMGWCLTVLTRTCHKRHGPKQEIPLSQAQDVPHHAEGPEDLALSEERRDLVMRAMAALPDAEQEAISLHVFGGLTIREAAAALEVPPSTLDQRIQKGIERLRGRLAPLSMAVSIAWLKALPPAPVPTGLEASLTAAAAGIAATGSGVGLVASSSLATGGIAMSLFSGKAGLGVSAVLAAALVVAGIQVHLMKEENGVLKEKLAQARKQTAAGNPPMGNAAQHQPDPAAPPSSKAAVAIPVAKDPGPAIPDVDALVAKVRAALEAKDAEAYSEAYLALLDAGEPAYPALIKLMGEKNAYEQAFFQNPEQLETMTRLSMAIMVRAPKLGGLMDAILVREGEADQTTQFAFYLLDEGARSRLPQEVQSALLLTMLRKAAASDSPTVYPVAKALLVSLKATHALPEIEKMVFETSERNSLSLVSSIAWMGGPEAAASLRRILEKTGDAEARLKIITTMNRNDDKETNSLLWELSEKETDERVRAKLMSALASRGENFDRIAQQLRNPQLGDRDRQTLLRGFAQTAMQSAERTQALWNLYDSEPTMRDELLMPMLQNQYPKATGILVQRLQSGQVTEKVSSALQDLDTKTLRENAEAMRNLAADPTAPLQVRTDAALGLYRVDHQGALGALMTGFPQLPESDRLLMAQSLGGCAQDPEARAVLEGIASRDPSEAVRRMAAKGLAR